MATETRESPTQGLTEGHAQRIAFLQGMRKTARAVGGGLGPAGWRALAERPGGPPRLLLDGAALASTYRLTDPLEDLGASLLRDVARGVDEELGDGTATAVLLAFALYRESVRALTAGAEPEELAAGIADGASLAEEAIGALARPASRSDLRRVATLAAEGDRRLGRLCLEVLEATGTEPVEVRLDRSEEYEPRLDLGWDVEVSFAYPPAQEESRIVREPRLVLWERPSAEPEDLARLLLGRSSPTVIVARPFDPGALSSLLERLPRGVGEAALVVPTAHELENGLLPRLARWAGARSRGTGSPERSTRIRSAVVRPGRLALFRHERAGAARDDGPSRAATVGLLSLAAPTDREAMCSAWAARKGLAATRAAMVGGVVPGGGLGLLLAGEVLRETDVAPDRAEGVEIVRRALEEPLLQLAANQGEVPGHVIRRIRASGFELALNGATGVLERRDQVRALDAAHVLQGALRHAASVVRLAIRTGAAVVAPSTENDGKPPGTRNR